MVLRRCFLRVESAHPRPGPCCRLRRGRASLLPGAGTISPRSRDCVGGTEHPPSSPLTPSINNFPPLISRAEIVPEAPFVARSGYTCRREVRAVDHIAGGSDSSQGRECNAGRRVQGSRTFSFSLGVLSECLWVAPVLRSSIVLSVAVCRSLVGISLLLVVSYYCDCVYVPFLCIVVYRYMVVVNTCFLCVK